MSLLFKKYLSEEKVYHEFVANEIKLVRKVKIFTSQQNKKQRHVIECVRKQARVVMKGFSLGVRLVTVSAEFSDT